MLLYHYNIKIKYINISTYINVTYTQCNIIIKYINISKCINIQFSSAQSLSRVQLFVTP